MGEPAAPAPARPRAGDPAREAAARALLEVLGRGRSLDRALDDARPPLEGRDRALARSLAHGVVRALPRLRVMLAARLHAPGRRLDPRAEVALLLGLHQLESARVPSFAAVSTSVALVRRLGAARAAGLVNATLRAHARDPRPAREAAAADREARLGHPAWWIDALEDAWPREAAAILAANDRRAPMTLRVNRRRGARETYLERLAAEGIEARATRHAPDGVVLAAPRPVAELPGFAQGLVSVQDEAAQLAAPLLGPVRGARVLDACAAPGGKSAHLLEWAGAGLDLVCVEADPERARRIAPGLERLGLGASVITGDARTPRDWWDGRPFDAVLLDAPCSGSGVIRRHPDIKLLRRAADVAALAEVQAALLEGLWPLLTPGGRLLYATCSVLPQENDGVVEAFLAGRPDALPVPIDAAWGRPTGAGRQILPGEDDMDGFYFAVIEKRRPPGAGRGGAPRAP